MEQYGEVSHFHTHFMRKADIMLELVAPVGSAEGVSSAVQNGAMAVYMSFGSEGERSPKDISEAEFLRAAEFCRIRGVKVYAVLESSPTDGGFAAAVKYAKQASRLGADAVIVHDLGLIRTLRRVIPDLPIHIGSRMNIHTLDGVKLAAAMGVRRVALSKELSLQELKYIAENSPIETEVFVQGPTCVSYSGQCYLSALSGRGRALDGACSRPCTLKYESGGRSEHPFLLKDTCLIERLADIEACGVTAVRIEGRSKGPEYAAVITDAYRRTISGENVPGKDEIGAFSKVFSLNGTSSGFLDGPNLSPASPISAPEQNANFFSSIRHNYLNREYPHIPVMFHFTAALKKPSRLAAADILGNIVTVEGAPAELSFHQELTPGIVQTTLFKTSGTPFYLSGVKCVLDKGIALDPAEIGKMRDEALAALIQKRKHLAPRAEFDFELPITPKETAEAPVLTVSVLKASQLSNELLELSPPVVYIPIEELSGNEKAVSPFVEADGIEVCAVLPRVFTDSEFEAVKKLLTKVKVLGITSVSCSCLDHIILCRSMGFTVRGDMGFNISNSRSLHVLGELGLKSACLCGLGFSAVRAMKKDIDTEAVIYGRLPVLLSRGCISKNITGVCSCESFTGIADQNGFVMPVLPSFGCRSTVISAKKLFLADRSGDYMTAGLWGVRLSFTTESAEECVLIAKRYLGLNNYIPIGC